MSKFDSPHASEEQLLRLADGELSAREAERVRSHLEACWECRAEFEEIQRTIGRCVRYRKNVLHRLMPPPPAPWADLYRQFARIDGERARPAVWSRLGGVLASPRVWAPAAAVAALLLALYLRFDRAPAVHAAELLEKAVAADQSRAPEPGRLLIRTRRQRLTRTGSPPRSAAHRADEAALEALFRSANYSWEQPLSARSFQVWRDGLSDKEDDVSLVRWADQSCYRIRTVTGSGDLAAATLKLRATDLRPVESTLEFRNNERVEITALPAETGPAAPPTLAARQPEAAPSTLAPLAAPAPAATPGDELQVLAALHQIGADLGDPVAVARVGGRVVVTGAGLGAERRRQIESALQPLPRVDLRLFAGTEEAGQIVAGVRRPESDQDRRAAQALEEFDALMARVYALRRLAERFPPDVEAQLTSAERHTLRGIRQEHAAALARRTAAMERLLIPAFFPADATDSPPAPALPPAWQAAAEGLFRQARRIEKLLGAALGGAPAEIPAAEIPSQAAAGMAQLRAAAEAYEAAGRER